ncbi:MAG: threonine synthase [Mesotoga sp.]|nr:threonine synthase [Mesotoga sp.]HQC14594.1 threonine synthase [Mesotoga prima]HQN60603.1 threonine synthase [Mesotoga prima]
MWRYREALPIESDRSIVTMSEGYTPLIEEKICGKNVFIKMDHLLPTGSYKDRGASLLVSYAREHQVSSLVEDSSGNAGCSIAAYSARAGISCEIFVPDHTSVGKLRQIEAYGSKVRLVEGSREDVSRKILEQTKESFYASHVYNPVFLHGTKTLAFEICEQLGWNSPGAIVVPVGNGTLLLGASIGFGELYSAGIVDNLPKIIAVQAENCAPLLRAFEMNQKDSADVNAEATVSEGIAIEKPVRGAQILKAVRDSRGTFVGVSEQEIIETWKEMSKRGHFVEPTSAATIAGLKKYISKTDPNETIASVFTGHGLKTACELFSWNKQKGLN